MGHACGAVSARIVTWLLVLGVVAWLGRTLWIGGVLRGIEPHFAGICRPVAGVAGPEDLTVDPETRVAWVSSFDRAAAERGESGRGAIYAYALGEDDATPVNATPEAPADFHPHGISLWQGGGGRDSLFVVNHAAGRHSIEIYDIVMGRLVHRRTLADPLLVSPNDVVTVSPDRFYVTNDHGRPEGFGRVLEEWLRLPLASVVYFDGSRFVEAATGIRMANGIQASPDGRTLYVAASLGREVRVYDREPESGALELRERIPLGTVPDNIELDAEGALWIAAHPKVLQLVRYNAGRVATVPSQVLRVVRGTTGRWQVEEVLLDRGDALSAASTAAPHASRLLVGAIRDSKFLDCQRR